MNSYQLLKYNQKKSEQRDFLTT